MNLEKVIFGFFILLAATLNFGFFIGDIDNPDHHNVYELYAAVVVNLIATVLKFGDRTQIGAVHLAVTGQVTEHAAGISMALVLSVLAAIWTLTPPVAERVTTSAPEPRVKTSASLPVASASAGSRSK